jgi:hypothetical protein
MIVNKTENKTALWVCLLGAHMTVLPSITLPVMKPLLQKIKTIKNINLAA